MICKHCGKEIDADSSFCPNCGKGVLPEGNVATTSYIQNEGVENQGGMCCPQCGHGNLQVITETNAQTVGKNFSVGKGCLGYLLLGPLGILCGACGQGQRTTTTNATYWVCPKCGKKFRNLEELRASLESLNKSKVALPLFIVGIFMILMGIASLRGNEVTVGTYFSVLLIFIVTGAVAFLNEAKKAKNVEDEIIEIEEGMSRFQKRGENINSIPATNEWKCSQCGRINQNYTGTCACGQKKH